MQLLPILQFEIRIDLHTEEAIKQWDWNRVNLVCSHLQVLVWHAIVKAIVLVTISMEPVKPGLSASVLRLLKRFSTPKQVYWNLNSRMAVYRQKRRASCRFVLFSISFQMGFNYDCALQFPCSVKETWFLTWFQNPSSAVTAPIYAIDICRLCMKFEAQLHIQTQHLALVKMFTI